MLLNKEVLESMQIIFCGFDDRGINFHPKGKEETDEGYYVTKDDIFKTGKQTKEGYESFDKIHINTFLEEVNQVDLIAYYYLNNIDKEVFSDWTHLSNYLGINKMVVLGVKVPEIIAKRFDYFSTKYPNNNRSTVLREIILEYLKHQIENQSDTILYDEDF